MAKKKETEVVAPAGEEEVAPEVAEPTHVAGTSFGVLAESAKSFVPALSDDLSEEDRRDLIREYLRKSGQVEDRLKLVQGELLYEVRKNEYWKEYDFTDESGEVRQYASLEEYGQEELQMARRQLFYLMEIYEVFVIENKFDEETLQKLEWSKAKEVTKVLGDKDCLERAECTTPEELLAKVGAMSVRETQEFVKSIKTPSIEGATGRAEPTSAMSFKVTDEQKANVDMALDLAGTMLDEDSSDKKGSQLDMICSDFLANAAGASGPEAAAAELSVIIKNIERTFGVNLTVESTTDERYKDLETAETAVEA